MITICVIGDDSRLFAGLIDWLNQQPNDETKPTTIFMCDGDVRERFRETNITRAAGGD